MSNKKVTTEQTEPYQQKIKAKHRRMKVRLIGRGKGPKGSPGSPFSKKPSTSRSKSAPPGFGSLGEDQERDPVINGLAKMIVNATREDYSTIQNHYFPMVNPDPQELAKAVVDVFIEDVLEFDEPVWTYSSNVVGALDVRYADYAIQEHLVQLENDWDKLKRMTKGDPDGFSIEDFKVINRQSYEGAIHVIKQRIQTHMAANNPVQRRADIEEVVRECIREVYKEGGVVLTEEQLDEALPRWMQKAGAYAGIGASLAGGVPSTAMADLGDSGVQSTQQVRSPAQEQRDFYMKHINTGTRSPFYENAEGFGLGYSVSDSDARNYALSFKLDTNGSPIPDSYKATAIVGDGQSENQDLTQAHQQQLQEIVESIDWASEYPAVVEAASEYSALTIGPLEWRGQTQVTGRDVSF